LKKFISEHPTLILTLSYFLVTAIGVLYSFFFYREFGISFARFADLSDFLLVSLVEPSSIAIFLVVVIFTFLVFQVDFWARRRWSGYGKWIENSMGGWYSDALVYVLVVTVFATIYVRDFAVANAESIKTGDTDYFLIRLADPGDHPAERTMALLGNTNRFSILFDPLIDELLIIPLENVSLMRKNGATDDTDQNSEGQIL